MRRRIGIPLLIILFILIMIVLTQCTDNSKPSTNDTLSYIVGFGITLSSQNRLVNGQMQPKNMVEKAD